MPENRAKGRAASRLDLTGIGANSAEISKRVAKPSRLEVAALFAPIRAGSSHDGGAVLGWHPKGAEHRTLAGPLLG